MVWGLRREQIELDRASAFVSNEVTRLLASPGLSMRERQNIARFKCLPGDLARLADIIPGEEGIVDSYEVNARSTAALPQCSAADAGCPVGVKVWARCCRRYRLNTLIPTKIMTCSMRPSTLIWQTRWISLGLCRRAGSGGADSAGDRLDFGRTNFYNDGNGKDHWPIGSYMIMEKDAPWGNRVVGLTDELHSPQGG